jgi:hypothetical protein
LPFDISYSENLKVIDIPKSFTIYITSRSGWQGIVDSFTDIAASPVLKINTFSSGIEMPLVMEINLVENLHRYSEVDNFDSDQCKNSMIEKIIHHINTSCSIACIPVQYSALVKGY